MNIVLFTIFTFFLSKHLSSKEKQSLAKYIVFQSVNEEDRIQAYSYNVAGYIQKPLSIDALTHTMSILSKYWMMCEMP